MLKQLEPPQAAASYGARPDLAPLRTLLPVIGGTVTEVLEQHLGEPLRATLRTQRTRICAEPLPLLALNIGESVLERRVLLRGSRTSVPVLYATSAIAVHRLDPALRHGLLATNQPIGRLIRDNRVEIFRELLSFERVRVPHVAALFGIEGESPLLTRTYRMWNGGKPIMLITEWFPC
jgi:chorismate-pyruvate lyase